MSALKDVIVTMAQEIVDLEEEIRAEVEANRVLRTKLITAQDTIAKLEEAVKFATDKKEG